MWQRCTLASTTMEKNICSEDFLRGNLYVEVSLRRLGNFSLAPYTFTLVKKYSFASLILDTFSPLRD